MLPDGAAGPNLATASDPVSGPPWNPEGHSYIDTGATADPSVRDDGLQATLVSPRFRLTHRYLSLLVASPSSRLGSPLGGAHVTVCALDASQPSDCGVLARVSPDSSRRNFEYRTIDLRGQVGKRVFLLATDETAQRRLIVDDVRANAPTMPLDLSVEPSAEGPSLAWSAAGDDAPIAGYRVDRATRTDGPWTPVGELACTRRRCPLAFTDRGADRSRGYYYRLRAIAADGSKSEANLGFARPYVPLMAAGRSRRYAGERLTGIAFPVGGIGAGGILHLGTGERNESWIFNGYGLQRSRYASIVPNSFLAVRTEQRGAAPVVRALQTVPVGSFPAMRSLTFTGEYPFARYRFVDPKLPLEISEGVSTPMIPGEMRSSAIPTAVYEIRLHNPTARAVRASVLVTQQNAVGFDGQGEIGGADRRQFPGYGDNLNRVATIDGRTRLELTGPQGSMALSMAGEGTSGTASWGSSAGLYDDFRMRGEVSGARQAASPASGATIDGALSRAVWVRPGATKTVRAVLSWNFPDAPRIFGGDGMQYGNWWSNANEVDDYVAGHRRLLARTQRYHDTFYRSNLPRYVLDRITGNTATLHTPTMFWAQNGFFGGWEGWGCCWNMPTHVWHYAQSQARLWPQIGRRFESQWLDAEQPDGLIPYRFNTPVYAIDGQLGVVLAAYRDHLTSDDGSWLAQRWPRIRSALDYVIAANDPDHDGVPEGAALTTLDMPQDVTAPWLGSLYLAALDAAARMAAVRGDAEAERLYSAIHESGRALQTERFWQGEYFTQTELSDTSRRSLLNAVDIDMLLGQWWADQLDLDDVYAPGKMSASLRSLFAHNFRQSFMGSNPFAGYLVTANARVFVEPTDGGMIADSWPDGGEPALRTVYSDEVWSGREYTAAAAMIARGQVRNGLRLVQAVGDRYDGRIRNAPYMFSGGDRWLEACGVGDGSGNPFGDDECGKWYGRALSSWSLLLALQGFSYDGPAGELGFAPVFRPARHRSFFTAGTAWGLLSQRREGAVQADRIWLRHGTLRLAELRLRVADGAAVRRAELRIGQRRVRGVRLTQRGADVSLRMAEPVQLGTGDRLRVVMQLGGT